MKGRDNYESPWSCVCTTVKKLMLSVHCEYVQEHGFSHDRPERGCFNAHPIDGTMQVLPPALRGAPAPPACSGAPTRTRVVACSISEI